MACRSPGYEDLRVLPSPYCKKVGVRRRLDLTVRTVQSHEDSGPNTEDQDVVTMGK